ncbi:nucleosome binding protein [Pelomyxa schiedti]|nr:nucleosome binding protein [Pelomyxa schiedti]
MSESDEDSSSSGSGSGSDSGSEEETAPKSTTTTSKTTTVSKDTTPDTKPKTRAKTKAKVESASESEDSDSESESESESESASEEKPKRKRTRRTKKKKDPDAPKRAQSGYIFFTKKHLKACRAEMLAKNPKTTQPEVMSELGKRWHAMTKEDKEPFEAEAKKDKVRFAQEMKNYKPKKSAKDDSSDSDVKTARKRTRRTKEEGEPVSKKSGYMFFSKEIQESVRNELKTRPGFKTQDVMKEVGARWKLLNTAQKKKYMDLAEVDKARYEKEMAAWKKTKGSKGGKDSD